MKREELERLHWTPSHVQVWRPEGIGNGEDVLKLAAAAPALALACLEALGLIGALIGTNVIDEYGLPGECREQLKAALKLAGVEVSDD